MSLRRQLLLVSILLLSLPWAGCQFIREMEGALRQGQEQSLEATALAVSAALRNQPHLLYPYADRISARADNREVIYARPREEAIIVDGYDDGWDDEPVTQVENGNSDSSLALSYQAVTRQDKLYLLIKVRDSKVVYHNPAISREPNGDHLILRTWLHDRRQDYAIATAAPGQVRGRYNSRIDPGTNARRIRGMWQDSEQGYSLELEIPLADTGGRLGFFVVDANGKSGEKVSTLGTIEPLEVRAPPWLVYTTPALQNALSPFAGGGTQLEVFDRYRWPLDIGRPTRSTSEGSEKPTETFWLLRALYRSILDPGELLRRQEPDERGRVRGAEIDSALSGQVSKLRYLDSDDDSRTLLTIAVPVYHQDEVIGTLRLTQDSDQYLSLTDQAFSRLLGYSLLAVGVGIAGLLGYASLLSWRIRSLSRAAAQVTEKNGFELTGFPRSRAPDEIGDLSRSFSDLLKKLQQYNEYLRTLSRKLSHELRTPIAVIQTSLENLEQHQEAPAEREIYLARARGGLTRLGGILSAMSEASGLEESIRNNRKRPLDLVPLLSEVFGAYQTLYTDHQLRLSCEPPQAMVDGAPELLVQALDKLLENAVSFCPPQGEIRIGLRSREDKWCLEVCNDGPTLPSAMRGELFQSMVSMRDTGSENIHMGLGLHIVRLIADYHVGHADISNRPDMSGVCCTIILPVLSE